MVRTSFFCLTEKQYIKRWVFLIFSGVHGATFSVGTSSKPEILHSSECCISPACIPHLTCLLVCFVKTGQIPACYWHGYGEAFLLRVEWAWLNWLWGSREKAQERNSPNQKIEHRQSKMIASFLFFFLAASFLFLFFLVSLVLHGKANSMRQHGLQNTICRFFVKWRKCERREFHFMHHILLQKKL